MDSLLDESGFRLQVDGKLSPFRLCQCPTYQRLSGKHLKEMDVGWLEPARVCFLELKGKEVWSSQKPPSPSEALLENLENKARDVLLTLAAVWSGSAVGAALAAELPRDFPTNVCPLKLLFVVDTPAGAEAELLNLNDRLNQRMGGRLELLGAKRISVVNFEGAQKIGLRIQRAS